MKQRIINGMVTASWLSALLAVAGCSTDILSSSLFSSSLFASLSPKSPLENAHTLVNSALAYEKTGDHQKALADFDAALALNIMPSGEIARTRYDRGVTLDELGRMTDALAEYNAALQLEPKFAAALNNRANIYRRLGDYATARTDYEASLAAGNREPQYPYYGLGQIAEAEGNAVIAQDCYRKALAANPAYDLATKRLAELDAPPHALHDAKPQIVARTETRVAQAAQLTKISYSSDDATLFLRPSILGQPERQAQTKPRAPVAATALIQLGAYRDEATATGNWNRLVAQSNGLLSGLAPQIVPVDLPGKGRFFRLRAEAGSHADTLCSQLKSRGLACIAVKG